MIRIRRGQGPAYLRGPDSAGGKERADSLAYYADPAHKSSSFPFGAYKDDSVKDALEELFNGKCAYCELRYAAAHPVDVEHFRPKGGYVQAGKLETPGYYWLAADWSNLLPSCIDCNRARHQRFARQPRHLSGKANRFPLADEATRARVPGEEKRERRLLLDPCRDHPERHLRFDDDGFVDPATETRGRYSPKGRASIEVYGLDRDGLVRARREILIMLKAVMHDVERLSRRVEQYPDDDTFDDELREKWEEMHAFTAPDRQFIGASRQAIERFETEILGAH